MQPHLITLTTDFGAADWFVGAMKGVILGLNPRAVIVDLTHDIPPGDIRAGAFALMAGRAYFPKNSIHVVVVDPGVGSRRQAVAVRTADRFFIGPDNGVLSWALRLERVKSIRLLQNREYFLETVSRTFHGRDIFAPVAAHVSLGVPLSKLGPELKEYARLPWPQPMKRPGEVRGEVVYLDRFGNAITNIPAEMISPERVSGCEVMGKRKVRCRLHEFYSAVPLHGPVAVLGSAGFLEFAVNGGSAARQFGLNIGDPAAVRLDRVASPVKSFNI